MKMNKTQATAIARVMFGGNVEYKDEISDEPGVKDYTFACGAFTLEIIAKAAQPFPELCISIQEITVCRLMYYSPCDLEVITPLPRPRL